MAMKLFKRKYRIVRDNYCGYEAQVKYWFWPFWLEIYGTNTSFTIEESKNIINNHKGTAVWQE